MAKCRVRHLFLLPRTLTSWLWVALDNPERNQVSTAARLGDQGYHTPASIPHCPEASRAWLEWSYVFPTRQLNPSSWVGRVTHMEKRF